MHAAAQRLDFAVLCALACVFLACDQSDSDPDRPVGIPPLPATAFLVDVYPAWSPVGSAIAYRRRLWSTQGQPGIYLVNSDGTGTKLIFDETPLYEGQQFPILLLQELRFSPDGRQLAFEIDREVHLLDVETGALRQLTHTDRNARSPDWSPDGNSIVYSRPFRRSPEIDSAGVYVIDVSSGDERALFHDGLPVVGGRPRWSPNGEPIAFWSGEGSETLDIFSVNPDGTGFRRLTHSGTEALAQFPRWLNAGTEILYTWRLTIDAESLETRVMGADGNDQHPWPIHLYDSEAISPDSEEIVLPGLQQGYGDSLAVLFVQVIDDIAGTSRRQLSAYAPVPPHSTVVTTSQMRDMEVLQCVDPWLSWRSSPPSLRPPP